MASHTDSDNEEPGVGEPSTLTRSYQVKSVASKLKSSAIHLLGRRSSDPASDSDETSEIFEDAAFNPRQVLEASPHEPGSLRDKLYRGAHRAAITLKNPERAIRSKYTRTIAENLTGEPTAYDHGADEELVDAYDALEKANHRARLEVGDGTAVEQSPLSVIGREAGDDPFSFEASNAEYDVKEARARLQQVQAQRESLRAGWVLGRYVKRVRVARPVTHPPLKSNFLGTPPDTQGQRLQWDQYLGHLALWYTRNFASYYIDDLEEAPFDPRDLVLSIERLAVISAPWQSFLVEIRRVYLWEHPRRTVRFLMIYSMLWYLQHFMTAMFAWIVYTTIRNRVFPSDIETVRKQVERAKGEQAQAQAWGELIQRHGRHDWVEPLLDEVGPSVQLHLSDLATLLEMIQSFYRWERPGKTVATLFFFFACFLMSLLTTTQFCVKLVEFIAGLVFFFAFPLAAKYPKYRRLVNPVNWAFWNIPNLAELAIIQLQEKTILRDAQRLENEEFYECSDRVQVPQTSGNSDENTGDSLTDDSDANGNSAVKTNTDQNTSTRSVENLRRSDQLTFRAVNTRTHRHGRLRLLRTGFWYFDRKTKLSCPYSGLIEVRKVEVNRDNNPDASRTARLARRIEKSTSLQFLPSGIEFDFRVLSTTTTTAGSSLGPNTSGITPAEQPSTTNTLSLTVSESDRDKIFSVVIGWSNVKWQPHFSLNRRTKLSPGSDHPTTTTTTTTKRGKGNKNFDGLVKSFVK